MRPPPNSAELFRLRRAGRVPVPGPFGHVAIVPSWELETEGAFITCPPDLDPLELDFACVAGLDCTLFAQMPEAGPPHHAQRTLDALRLAEPSRIVVVDLNAAAQYLAGGVVAVYVLRAEP